MELDEVMRRVAAALPAGGDLTGSVRHVLVEGLVTGRLPDGWHDAALLEWLNANKGGAGPLYQEMLRRQVTQTTDGGLAVQAHRSGHRQSGAYYTGDLLVSYMLNRARFFQPAARSVIDPACGAGAFLRATQATFGTALTRLTGWDVDPLPLALCREAVPAAELTEQDALLATETGDFDLCLGNPPYISSGLRGMAAQRSERARALRERYPQVAEYKLNTYPLFVERGLELLRPGGVLGYILPDSFLTGRYFAGLRRLLLRHTLLELTLIREDFWEHGRVGQSVILFVRKGESPPGHKVRVRVLPDPASLAGESGTDLPLSDLVWGPLQRFRLVPDPSTRHLLMQMETGHTLGEWLTTYSGLIGRRGQSSIVIPTGRACDGPVGRLLRSGREIDRYRVSWAGAHVCLDPKGIKSGGNRSYYERPKLLLRQTADSLRAAYEPNGLYCLNNVHLLAPARPDANLRALLGLINSGPLGRCYRALTMEAGRLYAQVDLDILESLPVPALSPQTAATLEGLVTARENAAPEEAAHLEAAIDSLVARLYGL